MTRSGRYARRRLAALLPALFAAALLGGRAGTAPARAAPAEPGAVVWTSDLDRAYAQARAQGTAVFLAVHYRGGAGAPTGRADPEAWRAVYDDPRVARAARGFVACQRVRSLPPDADARPRAPDHLVLAPDGRVLARLDGGTVAPGEAAVLALVDLLDRGRRQLGTGRAEGPTAPPAAPGSADASGAGAVPGPLGLAPRARGVRVHLGFLGVLPPVPGGAGALDARVLAAWDRKPPVDVGRVRIRSGVAAPDLPVDVPFASLGADDPLPRGPHEIAVWIAPAPGGYRFADAPIYLGLVRIDVGEGGGGGGGASGPRPDPTEPQPPPSPAAPKGAGEKAPPPPKPPGPTEVVQPFVRDPDAPRVKKEDALVAVPDPDHALRPPSTVPLSDALRDLDRVIEHAMGDEHVSAADRAYLVRYFEALRRAAGAGEGPR